MSSNPSWQVKLVQMLSHISNLDFPREFAGFRLSLRRSMVTALPLSGMIVVLLAASPLYAQERERGHGFPEDWSHHHLVFSNPGSIIDAERSGSVERWNKIVNDPRFNFQQLKRNGGNGFGGRRKKPAEEITLNRDWSATLGVAGVAPGMFPAKWQFFDGPGTPACSDYVVFPVNAAGVSGSRPNIVAYTNLYLNTGGTGLCGVGNAPTVLFSYFVGTGTVQTSPVLGPNVDQVAYVVSAAGASTFHVLKWPTGSGHGTVAAPIAPGAADVSITLSGGVQVTRSSPFYDYTNDIAYVGDDTGKLHKITGVFNGTPAEVTSGGWPLTVSTSTGKILTGPVLANGVVYVGDSGGQLYGVNITTLVVTASGDLANGAGIVDSPIVDATAQSVYVFVGDNIAGTNSSVVVFNIATGNITSASTGTAVNIGTSSATAPVYAGAFDNIYWTSSDITQPAGNLYACGNAGGNPTLYVIPITYSSGPSLGSVVTGPVLASSAVGCSPLTEFFNTSTSTDWLFAGVSANSCGSSVTTATKGGCVMSFNITSALTAATPGPWTPVTAYALNAQVVDTAGRIQKCTAGGCGATGPTSGVTTPTWTATTTTEAGTGGNLPIASITCTLCTNAGSTDNTISLVNSSSSAITFTTSSTADFTMTASPLASGATGTIVANVSTVSGATVTIGSVTYTYQGTAVSGGSATAVPVDDFGCAGCHDEIAENLFAAITGKISNCTGGTCFSPNDPLVWTFQSNTTGQTTAPEATGTSGIIVDTVGSTAGEANIYFGTLSGTGTANSGVKMSQSGLQ